MKKIVEILNFIKWIILLSYLILIMGFVKRERQSELCGNIYYSIDKTHEFVDTADIHHLLVNDSLYPLGLPVKEIKSKKIEDCIENHKAVKYAEVYEEINGDFNIKVKQKDPLMRIITKSNMQYYVDEELEFMPTGYNYTADVPVLSGYLPDNTVRYYMQGKDSLISKEIEFTMEEILSFADYIHKDELWSDMIVQVYINKDNEFELVPRVGDHIIILGSLDNYKYKMKKLEAIYKKALPEYGWKYYETINLKYSNQVVCSK